LHELALLGISSIKLMLELLIVVCLNILDILKFTKTQVVDLVSEIHFVALHIQSLNNIRVMMTTNMEVSWYFIDENES
jgi:hypothetical protein